MVREPGWFSVRLAADADIPALTRLIELSVRVLQLNDYTNDQIEGALGTVLGLDTQLIRDGAYYAAEVSSVAGNRVIVACGGWSRRKTLFGSDHGPYRENAYLNPASDAARIRAFFVHPDWVRRGLGSAILRACERAAMEVGFNRFEMGATLTGAPLYESKGYSVIERIRVPLHNGETLPVVRMAKSVC
jgi:GNAT superfamily N-acetyltransferase